MAIQDSPGVFDRVQWGPIFAGAIVAAATAFVLHTFAAAVGLAVTSPSPTWRDASIGLMFLSGVYLLLAALASYGLGGYIAGSLRHGYVDTTETGVEIRDGTQGLLVWGLATLLTAGFILGGASGLSRLAAPSAGTAGPGASVAGENLVAFDIDKLFRSDRRPEGDTSAIRAQAARILLTSSSHSGVQPEDRTHLARMVTTQTGLAGPDAEKRVDQVIASARDNIRRGRAAGVILAFMAGAAALLGAVAAWYGAIAGGRHTADKWRAGLWGRPRTL